MRRLKVPLFIVQPLNNTVPLFPETVYSVNSTSSLIKTTFAIPDVVLLTGAYCTSKFIKIFRDAVAKLILIPIVRSAGSSCPTENCYFFSADLMTWAEAKDMCKTLRSNMPSPKSEAENEQLSALASSKGFWLSVIDKRNNGRYRHVIRFKNFKFSNFE